MSLQSLLINLMWQIHVLKRYHGTGNTKVMGLIPRDKTYKIKAVDKSIC